MSTGWLLLRVLSRWVEVCPLPGRVAALWVSASSSLLIKTSVRLNEASSMWPHKEGWAPQNRCFQTVMLEKTLEGPLACKEIKPVNPKGNQPWIFIRSTDAEGPILWPPVVEESHHWKRPWYWKRLQAKGGGKMYYLHRMRWLNSITKSINIYESEKTLETVEYRGVLCAAVHGTAESDMT